ncbi:hypothetical protein [Longispora albida]|uniref:hypothetical protein n=1 Tax=Longispora albida TaxID=203523 RepID=UPI00037260CC|nr:hypothetical protein [Longispora albida]
MAGLVTVAQWPDYTTAPVPANAAALLLVASTEVRGYCGWNISAEPDASAVLDGDGSMILLLPTLLLTAVHTVKVDGIPVTDYEWSAAGVLRRRAGWPDQFRAVEVTFGHGYDPVPDDVAAMVVSVAARHAATPAAYRQEAIGAYSYTTAASTPGTPALEPVERLVLDRYRLPDRA